VERLASALEKKAVRRISLFISNSQHGADFLANTFGLSPGAIKVIRNGIALTAPEKSRQEWRGLLGADEKTFLACMVANLSRHKDHITLLKAWNEVVKSLAGAGMDCMLLLAGRFDAMEAAVQALAFDLDLGKHIRFLGGVDDIAGLLSAVDLGVFSSRAEGSPNGVLECMAAGLAVAGTDIPGIREVLCREGPAYLAPAEDSAGLARKIIELALNPALRVELGKKNRSRIDAEFNVEHMCKETAALLSAGC
jgi:glycosyltransferase involved in cell wall biosynthesis